ncbi:MAG TPA: class I lanthipeptide [Thermoanaerobaculia bacterium]|nr:class I lanthipeptide [Thermoanaerobaculia bacterium]
MNKKARKLVLSRETLQTLNDPSLKQVNGGIPTFTCGGLSWCLECPPVSDIPPC